MAHQIGSDSAKEGFVLCNILPLALQVSALETLEKTNVFEGKQRGNWFVNDSSSNAVSIAVISKHRLTDKCYRGSASGSLP